MAKYSTKFDSGFRTIQLRYPTY